MMHVTTLPGSLSLGRIKDRRREIVSYLQQYIGTGFPGNGSVRQSVYEECEMSRGQDDCWLVDRRGLTN